VASVKMCSGMLRCGEVGTTLLIMGAVRASETPVNFCQTTRRNIPQVNNLHHISVDLFIALQILPVALHMFS
jgi:hypothetical protein